ncbi:hypothetical protein KGF54_004294 [Candida jiufengensis]|uniref:uncharacterized protein n=1 Tax=Candida jiufengensis TaxID=497108 RepID=UPI00222460A4|nr:uncharacterized protein KGF54_004294 [Candida jiufengensis]KAI5951220.1 hypothetical protein KGF54_004294 [Candida jiufengensis]
MPLNLIHTVDKEEPYNYNQLRYEIIGNKDLKFKLFNDVIFINTIVNDFKELVENLLKTDKVEEKLLGNLEELAVILNILTSFALEVVSLNNEEITKSIQILEQILNPLCLLLNHFVEKIIREIQESNISYNFKVEAIIRYSLDMIVGLSNLGHSQIDSTILWRYINLLIIYINEDQVSNIIKSSLVVKSLRLIPILLSSKNVQLSQDYIITLLLNLFGKLEYYCMTIVCLHLDIGEEKLHRLAYESDRLPNIDLKVNQIVDLKIMIELITCISQILSFIKTKDYHDPLTFQYYSQELILLTTSDSSPAISITEIFVTLLILLKVSSKKVGVSIINLLTLLLEHLSMDQILDEPLLHRNYEKLFPKLVNLLDLDVDYDGNIEEKNSPSKTQKTTHKRYFDDTLTFNAPIYLKSAARILADLCTQYPVITQQISDTNIDNKLLVKLSHCFKSSTLIKKLKALKLKSKHGTVLVDFTSVKVNNACDLEIADLLLLLSVYTSDSEESRHRLLNSTQSFDIDLPEIIFEIIDNYHFLCNQVQLTYKIISPRNKKEFSRQHLSWFGKNLGVICALEDSPIYTNCFYFIRSNSRSVAALRTFFVECNEFKSFLSKTNREGLSVTTSDLATILSPEQPTMRPRIDLDSNAATTSDALSGSSPGGFVTNILEIIRLYESLDQKLNFFFQLNNNDALEVRLFKKNFMTNKAICISLLANFILDFSSFRYKIVSYENFLSSLSTIYQRSSEISGKQVTAEEIFENNVIQLKILQVIKNFMFNEASENKKEVLNYFPVSFIFQKANHGIVHENIKKSNIEIDSLKVNQKIVAFEILRNFTAGSPSFTQILREAYVTDYWENEKYDSKTDIPINWPEFILSNLTNVSIFLPKGYKDESIFNDQTLVTLLGNEEFVRLIRSINFTEDHTFTAIDKLKKDLFPNDQILNVWLRYLSFEIPDSVDSNIKDALVDNLNLIKLSIAWLLVNLTWNSTVFGYDIQNYTDYEVYQTVDTSMRVKKNGLSKYDLDNPIEEESGNDDELTVYDRARRLDDFGFTKAIYEVLQNVVKNSFKPENKIVNTKVKTSNEHDVFEKLKSALHQINYLTKKRNINEDGFNIPSQNADAKSSKNLSPNHNEIDIINALNTNSDNNIPINNEDDEEKNVSDDELRYERSRRRDAIDSEDDSQSRNTSSHVDEEGDEAMLDRSNEVIDDDDMEEDEEEEDDDDDDEDAEEEGLTHSPANDSDGSDDDDLPHEYWVM